MKEEKTMHYENASMRKSYVGYVFDEGEKFVKEQVLKSLKPEWSKLHDDGHIHIHDLDAYGITYNCLTFNLLNRFPYEAMRGCDETRKILAVFDYYKDIIAKAGNEQSGGMAFANFDRDTAEILTTLEVADNAANRDLIRASVSSLIYYCNNTHERMGQVSYYVTLNIGLADNDFSRFICGAVIEEFEKSPWNVFKPNIVFKVSAGVNRFENDANYYLFQKALLCTAKKMIPTYVLGDSLPNKGLDLERLSIMGCRTRVVDNLYGDKGSIGRGNIDNITINLPRIAFESTESNYAAQDEMLNRFKETWTAVADMSTDILIDRFQKLNKRDKSDFPTNTEHDLWIKDFSDSTNSLEDIFKNGTLSIGFIGLSEAVEILTGKKYWQDESAGKTAYEIVKFMRAYCDRQRDRYKLNFSLLATSGELISGRFPKEDKKYGYKHPVLEKGFYTNSFHIEVDSGISAFDKIAEEGKFHILCNGGCISYVELGAAPLGNDEGLRELVEQAVASGIHYLGFNFPLDVCNKCGEKGVFDTCETCGSDNITRIRRVSGYLEILDYFTDGKKAEARTRKKN